MRLRSIVDREATHACIAFREAQVTDPVAPAAAETTTAPHGVKPPTVISPTFWWNATRGRSLECPLLSFHEPGDVRHGVSVGYNYGTAPITMDESSPSIAIRNAAFEWNRELVNAFLRGPMTSPMSVPTHEGDGRQPTHLFASEARERSGLFSISLMRSPLPNGFRMKRSFNEQLKWQRCGYRCLAAFVLARLMSASKVSAAMNSPPSDGADTPTDTGVPVKLKMKFSEASRTAVPDSTRR